MSGYDALSSFSSQSCEGNRQTWYLQNRPMRRGCAILKAELDEMTFATEKKTCGEASAPWRQGVSGNAQGISGKAFKAKDFCLGSRDQNPRKPLTKAQSFIFQH
jgi:hypothetical protein